MRQVAGTDLRRLLTESAGLPGSTALQGSTDGQLAPERAVALLSQAARALDAAHRKGLVHRDVKPGNLLVERGGTGDEEHVYLTDFGITKVTSSRTGLTSPGEFVGTVDYIAPEQIRGISVTGLADQYSLACVLQECLTGQVPFRKDVEAAVIFAHVEEQPPPPSAACPDLPPALDAVLARALAKQPGDRYGTCREFTDAARDALAAPPAPAVPANAVPVPVTARREIPDVRGEWETPSSVRAKKARRWPAAVAALVLAGAAAAAWSGMLGGGPASRAGSAAMTAPARGQSPLMTAVAQANTISGKVPVARCAQRGAARVTCLAPIPGVAEAVFQTYPSLPALYRAYESAMKSLDGGRVEQDTQDCGLSAPPTAGGETGWNHQFDHPHDYTIAQMAAGKVATAQAAGRVFCVLNQGSGLTEFVWTQDDGRVLGWVAGPLHEQVWNWWGIVHHEIALGKPPMMIASMPG
jgi:hypothetical protein